MWSQEGTGHTRDGPSRAQARTMRLRPGRQPGSCGHGGDSTWVTHVAGPQLQVSEGYWILRNVLTPELPVCASDRKEPQVGSAHACFYLLKARLREMRLKPLSPVLPLC